MKNQTVEVRGLKSITSFKGLKPGDRFLSVSSQFNVANKIEFVSFDKTGLDRALAYFNYVDQPMEPVPFCIWEFQLNDTEFIFPYIF